MPKIINVIPNDDHTLLIELDNHHKVIYDMKPRLHTSRFCGLEDPDKFKKLKVEHSNVLVWDNLCNITIDEIIDMIRR